jgi:hypothetical protein
MFFVWVTSSTSGVISVNDLAISFLINIALSCFAAFNAISICELVVVATTTPSTSSSTLSRDVCTVIWVQPASRSFNSLIYSF